MGSNAYTYDANGNMLTRRESSGAWVQAWNVDNRATVMTNTTSGLRVAFAYDGDGTRVKKIDNGITTTVYVGTLFELNVTTGVTSTYYFAGGKRIAVRNGQGLSYLHGDQLGSNSASTNAAGTLIARLGYKPYGQTAWSTAELPAQFGYTGQRYDQGDGWIYDYGARFYDEYIGRFISADSIVPGAGNPQALNRYSYVLGNPLKYTDPSGHCASIHTCVLSGIPFLSPFVNAYDEALPLLGYRANPLGVDAAKNNERTIDSEALRGGMPSIALSAAIAVQGNAPWPRDIPSAAFGSESAGIAQMKPREAIYFPDYKTKGKDAYEPYNPSASIHAMAGKMNAGPGCAGCSVGDQYTYWALAQNGPVDTDSFRRTKSGGVDWALYFARNGGDGIGSSPQDPARRAILALHGIKTWDQWQVWVYALQLQELANQGESIEPGVVPYLQCVAKGGSECK